MAPRLSPGVTLLGPYRDSGLEDPPYLVRRADRIVQISRLLYVVAAGADGTRSFDEIAAVAGAELGRSLTGDEIGFLARHKLAPAGILSVAGDVAVAAPAPPVARGRDRRLLALRFRRPVVSSDGMDAGARYLQPLFRPALVAAVATGVVGLDVWLFGHHGVRGALEQVIKAPGATALVFALVCLSGAFHELGHAAGCRYSGGRPGAAGIGVYLWWPVLYTNVTDAYRLDRRGRLRTDLGGIYFNAVFTLAMAGAYAASGYEPLLAVVALEHVLVLQQLIPWLRLDGYYIVSDLTGVPDILSRIRPALLSLIPGRPPHPAVRALRPQARRLLFAYLVSVVLFVGLAVVPAVPLLPRMLAAGWTSLGPHVAALRAAAGQWDTIMVVADAVALAVLALPFLGLALTAGSVGTRLAGGAAGVARRATVRRRRRGRVAPVLRRPCPTGLALVEGTGLPGGGVVDWFGFGFDGELVVFGRTTEPLLAAADELASFSADSLDRLLIEGMPFVEEVARAARLTGHPWDEAAFRARLDSTLARRAFTLVVIGTNGPKTE